MQELKTLNYKLTRKDLIKYFKKENLIESDLINHFLKGEKKTEERKKWAKTQIKKILQKGYLEEVKGN